MTVRKLFFLKKRTYFYFFLKCFSWHNEGSPNDFFEKFCQDFKQFLMNVWKENYKALFWKKTIRTFLWQSWQKVPAKRPKSFPLRPENIIFSDKDIQKKSLEKVESNFENPVKFVLAECPENYRSRFGKCKFFTKQLCYSDKKLSANVRKKLLSGPIKKTIPDRSLWTKKSFGINFLLKKVILQSFVPVARRKQLQNLPHTLSQIFRTKNSFCCLKKYFFLKNAFLTHRMHFSQSCRHPSPESRTFLFSFQPNISHYFFPEKENEFL